MKKIVLMLAVITYTQMALAQLKTAAPVCPTFSIDILEGKINNDISTKSTLGEVKTTFPCFTELVEEPTAAKCGGVFYKDKDIYFYSDRGYFEIREKFKGKLSLPLMGASRGSLFKWLGYPKMKDASWDAFQTKYGILIAYYNKGGKINKLQLSNRTTDTIKLCE
jgi:NADH dehydrogenase/NADH:ubiquinone oxidoreductase subunit G